MPEKDIETAPHFSQYVIHGRLKNNNKCKVFPPPDFYAIETHKNSFSALIKSRDIFLLSCGGNIAEVTTCYATRNASEMMSHPRVLGEVEARSRVLHTVRCGRFRQCGLIFLWAGVRVFAWPGAALRTREPQVFSFSTGLRARGWPRSVLIRPHHVGAV